MQQQLTFAHILKNYLKKAISARTLLPVRLLGLLFLFCSALPVHADVMVQASLSYHTFPVDKAARLTITVTGGSGFSSIELPEVEGIHFHNRGQTRRVNRVNGSYSSSLTMNYLVQAFEPGKYVIPPVTAIDKEKTYTTQPIAFEVIAIGKQKKNETGTSKTKNNAIAFLRIENSGNHFTGEVTPITIRAYFSDKKQFNQIEQPVLKGDGVVMSQLPDTPQQTRDDFEGETYNVLTWQTTLSGIKTGKHPITFSLDCSLVIVQQRRALSPFGRRSIFDNLMEEVYQRKPITLTSGESLFNVIPIPRENRPENFTGAIGHFKMQVTANPKEINIGEPLTLSIDISGQGNFARVNAPFFPKSPHWKTYSPSSEFSQQQNVFSGTKTFEQAVVAKTDKALEIPSLSFSYFDVKQNRYITIKSSTIPIKVQKNTLVKKVSPAPPTLLLQQTTDKLSVSADTIAGFAPIQLEPGSFHQDIVPLFQKTWFIFLCALCCVVLLSLFFLKIRLLNTNRHPDILKKRAALRLLEEDLHTVERAKTSGDNLAFLLACRTTIQNQLGFIWNIKPTAISLENIRTRLQNNPELIEIFGTAEQAAYGGETLSDKRMLDYSATLQTELRNLL